MLAKQHNEVMLDALDYYLNTSEERMLYLKEQMTAYEKRLDYYVVMAQLDISMIDIRDETNLTLNLIVKKVKCFEEYLKHAGLLYDELLEHIKNNN